MKLKLSLLLIFGMTATLVSAQQLVGDKLTNARAADGMYISWKEHIIDDPESAGFALSGSDGLVMADLDQDGFEDIVSVHESDEEYESTQEQPGFVPPPTYP